LSYIHTNTPWDNRFDYDQRREWIEQNPYVCMLPFNTHGIQVEFNNKLLPEKQKTYLKNTCCCNLIVDQTDDVLPDTPINWFNDIQQTIINAEPNARCQRCYKLEAETGSSERVMSLISTPADEIDNFLSKGQVNSVNFKIKFSNLCNLACRSCSPAFSSKYAQVHNLEVPQALNEDIGEVEEVWNFITKSIQHYVKNNGEVFLSIYGGESLIQPGAIKLLSWLYNNHLAPQISLDITTNLTKVESKLIDLLGHFRAVHFAVSIDSVNENYNYVRCPADFNQVKSNLELIHNNINNININLQPLWNLNNIFYINDYLTHWQDWFDQQNIHNISISNVVMINPFSLTIQNLPVEYRPALVTELEKARNHRIFSNGANLSFKQWIDGMIEFAQSSTVIHNEHGHGFEQFLFNTAKHDCANKTQMQTGNKKFYDILSIADRELLASFQNGMPIGHYTIYQSSL
jgi:hypothetical protein